MPIPRSALICAVAAGGVAAAAVVDQRVGLALTVALALVLASGIFAATGRVSIPFAVLAAGLVLQPSVRDAGWVVALDVVAVVAAGGIAVVGVDTWQRLGRALLAPLRLLGGSALVARTGYAATPSLPGHHVGPVVRGVVFAALLTLLFGGLFVAADSAFAELVDKLGERDLPTDQIVGRAVLGLVFLALAGALIRAATGEEESERASTWAVGRVELRIALSAVVALFVAFVSVQLHVLFGGAAYVQRTTGLGYGEYARQGFVQLLAVAALTLAIIGVAARRPDRIVRGLLGALCVLTLVVLVSAEHRLLLVQDAYGLTRVRYAGHAVVAWFVVMFGLVLAAGVVSAVARRLPYVASFVTLAGVLAFSLSNPDGRIAGAAVARADAGRLVDIGYLARLSADALPALERLPQPPRDKIVARVRARLARADGLAGANLSRARAR